jgi:4-amino-4-deoxy-L-arabinose transferase-like glycosyltransferase
VRPETAAEKVRPLHLAVLIGLCLLLFFSLLGERPLWDIDEGMHAATSKDMVVSGDWVTPMLNGEPFFDKPPLFNWLVALSFLVFGFTEFAARLPSAVVGTACVLVTYSLGSRMFDRTVGLLGGVVLASSIEFLLMSRVVVHDIVLAFPVTVALSCFWLAFSGEQRRTLHLVLFYVACGVAVVAKGPLGLVLVGLVVGPFLLLQRRLDFVLRMGIPWGAVIFLVVAAPWYVAVSIRNPGFASYFFLEQNLGNFASAEPRHPEPWHFYLPILIAGLFPWSGFLPLGFARSIRRWGAKIDSRWLFLAIWVVGMVLFFSVASSKLPSYLLPMFPAASLLVALVWRDLVDGTSERLRRPVLVSVGLLAAVLCAALAYYTAFELAAATGRYGLGAKQIVTPIAVLCAGLGLSFAATWWRRYRLGFSVLAATVVALIFAVDLLFVPSINPYRSTKGLARRLDGVLPAGEPIVFLRELRDSALFYTDRGALVLDYGDVVRRLKRRRKPAHCVMDAERYEQLGDRLAGTFVLDREGGKLVVANRPSYAALSDS